MSGGDGGDGRVKLNCWAERDRRWHAKSRVKSPCATWELPLNLGSWSVGEESGMPGGGVKSVDIGRNISGEGDYLAHNLK